MRTGTLDSMGTEKTPAKIDPQRPRARTHKERVPTWANTPTEPTTEPSSAILLDP